MKWSVIKTAAEIRQPVLFLGAGFAGTLMHYAILFVLTTNYGIEPVTASGCGAIAGAAIVHTLNYYLTFQSRRPYQEALIRFIPALCVGFVINAVLLKTALDLMGWPLPLSQFFATVGQCVLGFIISRSMVY